MEEKIPEVRLYSWGGLLTGLIVYRLMKIRSFKKMPPIDHIGQDELHRIYRGFFISALLTALLVGFSVPLFVSHLHDPYLLFTLFIYVIGIASGAMAALFPSLCLATLYALLSTIPIIIYLIGQPEVHARIDGMAIILLVIILPLIAQTTRQFMRQVYKQQKSLHFKEQELRALFKQTPTPIFYFDTKMKIRKSNEAFKRFFGITTKMNLDGFDLNNLHDFHAVEILRRVLENDEAVSFEGPYLSTFNPKEYWIEAKAAPLHDENDRLIGGIVSLQDKTLIKQNIDRLEQLASLDILTNLGNRRQFLFRLKEVVGSSAESPELSMLFFLDLNQFKPINDTLGHHFGDRVLQEVARLLKSLLPDNAQLFRYGGDEFVILFPHCCKDMREARERGVSLALSINDRFREKIVIDNYHLPMQSSIGIVIITPDMNDADEIIRHADISMYQAKSSRSDYAFYDEAMDKERRKSFYLRHELNQPKLSDELRLHYQPIYSLKSDNIVGAEALIRWEHPTMGLLYPNEFIPLAIEGGEIGHLGKWVAKEVCRMTLELKENFSEFPLEYISYNVDARELKYQDFSQHMEKLLKSFDIDPKHLVLEITENSLIDNFRNIKAIIGQLESLGFRWAIDDFGVGYSSLSYLQRLSLSLLKIDRSFTLSLEENPDTVFLIEHLLKIARHLGYRIIVEGVETARQVEILKEISPDVYCQGFYFSHPLSKEEFIARLQRQISEHSNPSQG